MYQKQLQRMRHQKLEKNKTLASGVKCMLCEMKSNDLTSHITRTHCSIDEYKVQFPNTPIRSEKYLQEQSERIKGCKNPAYQHGGKYSPFSDKFIHGKDPLIHTKISTIRKQNKNETTSIDYYLKRGLSLTEAKQKLLICVLLSSEELFARCQNILKPKYWQNKYRPVMKFILDYANTHKALPKVQHVNAEHGLDLELISDLNTFHIEAFLTWILHYLQ